MTINEWDEYAREWEDNAATSVYADNAYGELARIVALDGQRVLDFGCGTGLLAERLSPDVKEIVALDGSSKMIEQLKLKALPNVFPIAGFLNERVIETNTLLHQKFDLVTASSVCGFLPDYEAALMLLKSLMVPDATYIQWDWLSLDENSENGFTERRVERALGETGFKSITITRPFQIESSPDTMTVLMAVAKTP